MSIRKTIFGGAVAIFVAAAGALTVTQSLNQSNLSLPIEDQFGQEGWRRAVRKLEQRRLQEFFVLVNNGYNAPEVVEWPARGDRILGDCRMSWARDTEGTLRGATWCTNNPGQCGPTFGRCQIKTPGPDLEYAFERTSATQAVRLFKLKAHPWIMGGWKRLGDIDADVAFAGARKDVRTACAGLGLGNAQCRNLLDKADPCWRKPNGDICHNGVLKGPGKGGADASGVLQTCTHAAADEWFACGVTVGEDPVAVSITDSIPPEEQLDFAEDIP